MLANRLKQTGSLPRSVPPMAARLPLVGALPYIFTDKLDFFTKARARHGDVFTADLGMIHLHAFCHPRHAQYILRDQVQKYVKHGPLWDAIRDIFGNGLPVSDGDFWKRQRRMIIPHLHGDRLSAMTEIMNQTIDESLTVWDHAAKTGEPINVARELAHIAMRISVKTMFGATIAASELDAVAEGFQYLLQQVLQGLLLQRLPSFLPVPGRRRYTETIARIHAIVDRIIEDRRLHPGNAGNDLIGVMIDTVDAETGAQMTPRQLRDEVVSLFLAGFETTSTSMALAFYHLSQEPALVREIRDEILRNIGEGHLTSADLGKIPLTLAAIKESMRLFPTGYWLVRMAQEDDEIDGYFIRKGSTVAVMVHVIHRHPEVWPDPDRYLPSRFMEAAAGRSAFAFIPFGTGQRVCIGRDFALNEGLLLLARALLRYDLAPVPDRPTRLTFSTTLRPKNGVWLKLSPSRGR